MAEKQSPPTDRPLPAALPDTGPKTAPETGPTNPYHEEATGLWTRSEEVSVWKVDEPGLTDPDRLHRAI
jgi:hypothetical protein